jgi:hypothetical protein
MHRGTPFGLAAYADPVQKSDAWGFALFWAFLGTVAVVCGALAVWIMKTHKEDAG